MGNHIGSSANDTFLDQNPGNDFFNGKGGIDTLVSAFTWSDKAVFDMLAGGMIFNGNTYDTFKNIENLTLGGGADVIGDSKDNVIKFVDAGGDAHDNEVHAGDGDDTVKAGIGNDEIWGNRGNDKLFGGADDDYLSGGKGNDFLKGGNGEDTLIGGEGRDLLKGGSGDDKLTGGDGRDTLKGGAGNDHIYGGNGRDTIKGGSGNDIIMGGAGNDILVGGSGADSFVFSGNSGSDVIKDFEDGVDLFWFNFGEYVDEADLLEHFYEIGTASDDVVGFKYDNVEIRIEGLDLGDIGASDFIGLIGS